MTEEEWMAGPGCMGMRYRHAPHKTRWQVVWENMRRMEYSGGEDRGDEVTTQQAAAFLDQPKVIRCVFPFRFRRRNKLWLTSTVLALADGIRAELAFDRLPILADALQDAGCDYQSLLDHCRNPGPHFWGCWAIDYVRPYTRHEHLAWMKDWKPERYTFRGVCGVRDDITGED